MSNGLGFLITKNDRKIIESNWNTIKGPHNTAGIEIWKCRVRIKIQTTIFASRWAWDPSVKPDTGWLGMWGGENHQLIQK